MKPSFALLLFLSTPALADISVTLQPNTMQVVQPFSPTILSINQFAQGALLNMAVEDSDITVQSGKLPVRVATGINTISAVQVSVAGGTPIQLGNGGGGVFYGIVDLTNRPNRPVVLD